MVEINLNNIKDTKSLAIKLANLLEVGDVISLEGNLGVGKTSFVQFLVKHLSGDDSQEVLSPTFSLVHIYDVAKDYQIYHFDMYRLNNYQEAYELGVDDAFVEGVSLIEWGDKVEEIMPEDFLKISFYFCENNIRKVKLIPYGNWQEKIKRLIHDR